MFFSKTKDTKIFISSAEFQISANDTLDDGTHGLVLENIDAEFATSTAILSYVKYNNLILSDNQTKNKIKYEDLISTIKKFKNNFFDKYEFYILEPDRKGYYKAYKVFRGEYFESKDKTGLDILSDF